MSILEIIKKRHSVRSYLNKPIEKEKIAKICLAGLHSPSARNRQPYKVIIVDDPILKRKVVQANDRINFWMKEAPVIFVICVKTGGEGGDRNKFIDVGIMSENMMLEATSLELGTCACAAFEEEEVGEILNIPNDYLAVLCLPCGYPSAKYRKTVDISKIYEKVSHLATHYKGHQVEDIFSWNEFQ